MVIKERITEILLSEYHYVDLLTVDKLLDLFGIGIGVDIFSYNQKITYRGKQYYFKEQDKNKILIANAETTNCPEMYNDWWVYIKDVY